MERGDQIGYDDRQKQTTAVKAVPGAAHIQRRLVGRSRGHMGAKSGNVQGLSTVSPQKIKLNVVILLLHFAVA